MCVCVSVCILLCACLILLVCVTITQMAERLGSRVVNQKVVGSIPGRAK